MSTLHGLTTPVTDAWLFVRCLFWVGLFTGLIFAPLVCWVVYHFDQKGD
jgi:hypothetical protein